MYNTMYIKCGRFYIHSVQETLRGGLKIKPPPKCHLAGPDKQYVRDYNMTKIINTAVCYIWKLRE